MLLSSRFPGAGRRGVYTLSLVLLFHLPAAADGLCDSSFQDCRTPLLNLIRNEQVRIDVAFWFMRDQTYTDELIQRFRAGVPVRVLMDTDANSSYPENEQRLAELRSAGIPMRERIGSGILHWKTMIFAGQNIVEFSGANYSATAFAYSSPYTDYTAEAIYFADKASVVNSFKTRFDDLWTDTSRFQNFANVKSLARAYARYPKDPELNFPPTESYADRAIPLYNQEVQKIDVIMYRITDQRHTDAMINAVRRGVPVRLLTEPEQYRDPTRLWHSWNVDRLYMAGVAIKHRRHAGLNHQKSVLLYGQHMTIFGSSNWTSPSDQSQEEHNYFTGDPSFFQWFVNQFERKWNNGAGVVEYENFVPLPPPEGPQMPTPANGAASLGTSGITLRWYGGPFAHRYDIYLGVTPDPPLVAQNVALGPSTSPTTFQTYPLSAQLLPGLTYYWRVVGKTMADQGTSSAVWYFTTSGTSSGVAIPGGIGPQPTSAAVPGLPAGASYDLFWRHDTEGWLATWQMNGLTMIGASALSINQMSNASWKIGGTGDLNGDGEQDILWQNDADGTLAAWFLLGTRVVSTGYLSISRVSDLNWKVRGVGDANGDGYADLVWHNAADGQLALWLMNGRQVIGTSRLSVPRISDTSWKVRAAGDTNGDRRADILWQHTGTGALAVWLLNGSTVTGTYRLSISALADTNWQIAGAQDVNGDGRADILWQHSTGSIATWFLQGPTVTGTSMFNPSGVTSAAWKIVGPK
ncbi:MAG: phospholipase D-like domain-containing protein [Vicinamibacterales bacterium]